MAKIDDLLPAEGQADERRASASLAQALVERRALLGGEAAIPDEDKPLSERILDEARCRSEHISLGRSGSSASQRMGESGAAIPWWLWLAWGIALVAVIAAIKWLI